MKDLEDRLQSMPRNERMAEIVGLLVDRTLQLEHIYRILSEWWCDTEYPQRNLGRNRIKLILGLFRAGMENGWAMLPDDLPDRLIVFRGCAARERCGKRGISWTLSREKAEWFARRFACLENKDPILLEATVAREAILAYIGDRKEHEVIIDPATIEACKVYLVPPS